MYIIEAIITWIINLFKDFFCPKMQNKRKVKNPFDCGNLTPYQVVRIVKNKHYNKHKGKTKLPKVYTTKMNDYLVFTRSEFSK